MKNFIENLKTYYRLASDLYENPNNILKKIVDFTDDYQQYVYPCDIIKLRPFLSCNTICHKDKVILFPYLLANKILSEYSVFFEINPNRLYELNEMMENPEFFQIYVESQI